MLKKKVINAPRINYDLQTAAMEVLKVNNNYEKGSFVNTLRIINNFDEPIYLINEYEEITLIENNLNKPMKEVNIYFSHSKTKITGQNNRAININLTLEHFKEYGCVYIDELNIVLALTRAYDVYAIKHPFCINNYDTIMNKLMDELREGIIPLGFVWYINEPEETYKTFYMSIGNEVIKLEKLHYQDKYTSLAIIAPKIENKQENIYTSEKYNLSDIDEKGIKEIPYSCGKNNYTFYVSHNKDKLYEEIDKRNRIKKSSISKADHELALINTKDKYEKDINELKIKHQNEMDKIIREFDEKIKLLMKERENLQATIDATNAANKAYSQYHKMESEKYQSEKKNENAKYSTDKERLALWGDFIKYGLTSIATIVTMLVVQKASK